MNRESTPALLETTHLYTAVSSTVGAITTSEPDVNNLKKKIEIRHVYIKVLVQLSCSLIIYEMILHEKAEGESRDQPVHILILVSIDDSTVFQPCHSGLGCARGLAGQRGLNIDCNHHIQRTIRDGRRDYIEVE